MGPQTDERYLKLPSHVRVVTGLDLENKCNLVVEEEASYGFILFKVAVSCFEPSDSYPINGMIVLCFRKAWGKEAGMCRVL